MYDVDGNGWIGKVHFYFSEDYYYLQQVKILMNQVIP